MLSCSIRFSAPRFWMGGGLVSETCRAKNILIKLPFSIKLAFHINSTNLLGRNKEIHKETYAVESVYGFETKTL